MMNVMDKGGVRLLQVIESSSHIKVMDEGRLSQKNIQIGGGWGQRKGRPEGVKYLIKKRGLRFQEKGRQARKRSENNLIVNGE